MEDVIAMISCRKEKNFKEAFFIEFFFIESINKTALVSAD